MENKTRKQMKTPVRILLLVVLALLVAASGFGIYFAVTGGFGGPAEPSVDLVQAEADFRAQMADSSVHEVTLSENLVLTSPVEVVGDKVITGEGSLTAAGGMEGKYLVTVPGGVSLTLSGDVKLDAAGVSGGVYVAVNGTWTLEGNAAVLNAAEGTANVMAEGKLQMQGGSLSGGYHNVVLAKGAELTWSAGTNSASISSGIVVEEGAKLSVTSKDAVLTGSGLYGIDLQGDAVIQDGTLTLSYDTMIKVAPTGTLEYKGGTMTDAGYHGIENAGTVNVTGGFINKSYNSGIVNTGKLTVTSGTIMNSTNKGIMNKLNGQAMIGGDAMISTNKFAISNEDNAYMELTSADIMASVTTNIYAYGGEMYIHDIELSASGSNNVRVVAATVTMKDVVVAGNTSSGSSTTHGILLEGGKVEATDVTIRGTKGNAVRNKGGEFIGKNITTQNIGNIAVSNRNQDVTDRQGIVTIDNLVVENSRYNNVLAEGGITTITNSVLNQAGTNNIKISDGTVVLSNVQILGNVEGAATNVHGIYITGGKLQANDIHVEHVAGAAFRVNGETAVVDVKNLTTAQLGMYSVSASVGELHFTNAVFAPTKSNNLRLDAGSMELTNVDIQGHYEGSATNVHAIYVTGGVVTAKDLDITNPTGSGLRNNGGELKVEDLSISGVGTHTLQLTGNGKTSITNAVLGEAKSNNIMLINGELNMNNVKVEGHVEGSAQNLHGILAGGGKMTGDSITFTGTSGSAIRNKGADMVLTNVTVDNFGGYNAVSNAYNDDGESYGNVSIDGLVVTNALADTENLVVISNECAGSMSIVNAKLLPNTDTVTAQTNIAVHGGSVTVKDVELGKTFSNNVRVNGGVLNIENVTIPGHVEGSAANVHGLYTPGGEVIAKDLTITGTTGAGLRNAGGKVTIDNFLVENVGTHTLYISGGETVLNGATVGKTGTNNVAIHDGKVTLNDTKVLGHLETAPGDAHAIFVYGGQLDMNGVTVTGTTGSGLRVRDGEVTGKDVILENIGSSALNISGGNTTIDGVTTTNVGSNNINAWGGEIKVINAALCATKTHNVKVESGKVTVNESTVNGHVEGVANNLHAFYVTGGAADINDTIILNPAGDGLRVGAAADEDGKIISVGALTGSNVTISGAGRHGIWVTDGSLSVDGGTVTGLKNNNNNVLVTGGVASLSGMTLDTVNKNNNICVNGGELSLHDMTVHGNNTTDMGCHGLYVNGDGKITSTGYLKLMDPAGAGIRIADNAVVSAANVTISNAGHYGMRITGNAQLTIDGLDISGTKINNVLVESGNVTLKNAVLNETNNNNIKLIGGHLTLETVEVLGHVEGSKSDVHGVFLEGTGVLDAKDLLIANTTGQALRVKGSEATVDGLILRNIGAGWLVSNTAFNGNPGKLSICGLGLSSGCSDADVVVHTEADGSRLELSDSLLSLGKDTIGVVVQGGEAVLDNVNINGGRYAVQNYASVTLLDSCLVRNVWSLRNETGAEAVLDGGFYFGNKEGTLPSDIYNDGVLTISDITVGYNRSGKGTSGVIYQAANASPIVLKGAELGVHTPSKPILLAAADWVKKWGQRVPIVICDSVDIAVDVENSFKEGKNDPVLYISQRDNHLELTTQGASATQPGGNYIVQIGEVRFESFADAFAYIEDNDEFNVTGDYKKAATIQVIDSFNQFENVVIPEGYHITLVDDGDANRVITNDTDGHMFTVGENAKLTVKSTDGETPVTGLSFNGAGKEQLAVFCVDGGMIDLLSDLDITNAYYGIQLVSGEFDANDQIIHTAGTYGVNAVGGKLYNATLNGSGSAAIYVGATETGSELSNITVNGYTDGIRSTDGKLTVNGLTVNDPGTSGVYLTGNGGNVTISDLKVIDTDKTDDTTFAHGIKIEKGTVTVNGAYFDETNARSIRTYAGATVNLSGDVTLAGSRGGDAIFVENATVNVNSGTLTITGSVRHGIYATGENAKVNISGDVTIGNVDYAIIVENGGSVTAADGTKVTISSANYGLVSWSNSVIALDAVDISGVKNNSIYVDGNSNTDAARTGVTIKSGTIGTTEHAFNIYVFEDGKLSLSNATVTHTSTVEWVHGTDKINTPVHVMGNSQVALDNVTLNGGKYGIRVHYSKNVTLNDVTINDSTVFGMWLQAGPLVTVTGELDINNTGSNGIQVNSGTLDAANATSVVIKEPGKRGIEVGGTANFNNLTVTGAADSGIYTVGTVTLAGANIVSNSGADGIYIGGSGSVVAESDSSVTVNDAVNGLSMNSATANATLYNLTVNDPTTAGIYIGSNGGTAQISGLKVLDTDKTDSATFPHGVKIEEGTLTVNGGTFDKSSARNFRMYAGSTVNLTGEVTILGSVGTDAIFAEAATLNVDGGKLTISDTVGCGINLTGSMSVTNGASVNISNTDGAGLSANTTGSLTMEEGTSLNISNTGAQGLYVTGGVTAVIHNATIKDPTGYGLQLGKGTITGSNIVIHGGKSEEGAVGVGADTDATITGLKVYGSAANLDYLQWAGKVTLIDSEFTGKFYITQGELTVSGVSIDTTKTTLDSTATDAKVHGIHLNGANAKVNIAGNLTIKNANYAILNQAGGSVVAADGTKVTVTGATYGLVCWDNSVISLDEVDIANTSNDAIYSDGNAVENVERTGVTVDKLTISVGNRGINVFDSGIVTITGSASITDCKTRGIAVGTNGKLDASAATSVELTDCGYYDSDSNGESNNQGMSVDGIATINNLTMKAVNENVNYHSIKLNNANAVLTLTGTTTIGNSVSNNVSVAFGTLNLNGTVTIGNNSREYGMAIEAKAKAVNITGSLTVGGKSGGIVVRGGVLNLKDATLTCTTANKHCVRVEKSAAVVNASGKVVADIHYAAAGSLNVVEPLAAGSSITLSWADGVQPADHVAADFVKADGSPDADSMNTCETGKYLAVPESGNYTLRYMTLSDGRTVARLVPKLVMTEADLDVLIELAKLDGVTNPVFTVGGSFSVSKQIDLSGFTSVTITDDGNTETGSTITYNGTVTGSLFLGDSVTTLSLTGITLDCSDKVNLQVAAGDTLNLTDVTVLQGNNRAIDAAGNVHIAGTVKVNDTTAGGERYAIVMRESAQLTSATGSSISIDGGQYGLVVWGKANCTVESLTTTGLTHGGIFINGTSNLMVNGGSITGASTGKNLYIQGTATVEISNMTISDAAKTYNVDIQGYGTTTFNNVNFNNTKNWNFVVEVGSPTVIVNGGKITGSAANKDAVYLAVGTVTFNGTEISGGSRNNVRCLGTGTYTFKDVTVGTSGSNNVVLDSNSPTVYILGETSIGGNTGEGTVHGLFVKCGTMYIGNEDEDAQLTIDDSRFSGVRLSGGKIIMTEASTLTITDPGDDGINMTDGTFIGYNVTAHANSANNKVDGTASLYSGKYGFYYAGGSVTLGGKVDTDIMSWGKVLTIDGVLDAESTISIDWAKEVNVNGTFDHSEVNVPSSGIGVQFDSADAMNANKGYFTVTGYVTNAGGIEGAKSYVPHYSNGAMYLIDTANMVMIVTNEDELNAALDLAETYSVSDNATIVIGDSFAVTKQVDLRGIGTVTIKDDGNAETGSTITYSGSETSIFAWNDCKTLSLNGVTIDGGKKGNVIVPADTTLKVDNVTIANTAGFALESNGAIVAEGNLTVKDAGSWGIVAWSGCTFTTGEDVVVTITGGTYGLVVRSGSDVDLNTLNVSGVSESAIYCQDNTAKLSIDNAVVDGAKMGLNVKSGTVNIADLAISNTSGNGMDLSGGTITLNNATVDGSNWAVRANASKLTVSGTLTLKNSAYGMVSEANSVVEIEKLVTSGLTNSGIYVNGGNLTIHAAEVSANSGDHNVYVAGSGTLNLSNATIGANSNSRKHTFYQKKGTVNLSNVAVATGADGYAVYHDAGTLNVQGKVVSDIYFTAANTLNVTDALTGNVTVDWATAPNATAISFANADILNASKPYISLGSTQAKAGNVLTYEETTAKLTAATAVSTWDELASAISAMASGESKAFKLTSDLTATKIINIPDNRHVTIIDDGTQRTILRGEKYTAGAARFFTVNTSAELHLTSTSLDNDAPMLILDGGSEVGRAITANGALVQAWGYVDIDAGVELCNNECTGSNRGPGIYVNANAAIVYFSGRMSNIGVSGNDTNAGAICVNVGELVLNNAIIENCYVNKRGVIEVCNKTTVTVYNTLFQNNWSINQSGGVFVVQSGGELTVEDSVFRNNTAKQWGGAIAVWGGKATITGCEFISNNATTQSGGAILNYSGGTLEVADTVLESNYAKLNAGAIALWDNTNNTFTNCVFGGTEIDKGNTTNGDGGAVQLQTNPTAKFVDCKFINNSAVGNGGAIKHNSGTLNITNCQFTDNTAAEGNAVYSAASATATGCTFNGLTTPADGQVSGNVSIIE